MDTLYIKRLSVDVRKISGRVCKSIRFLPHFLLCDF